MYRATSFGAYGISFFQPPFEHADDRAARKAGNELRRERFCRNELSQRLESLQTDLGKEMTQPGDKRRYALYKRYAIALCYIIYSWAREQHFHGEMIFAELVCAVPVVISKVWLSRLSNISRRSENERFIFT